MLTWTEAGLYCEAGGFHIDPHRAVERALLTHAHSDHARRGSRAYLTAESGVELVRCRLGASISIEGIRFGERRRIGDVTVSFHPAGHILGSAQIRVERAGEVWVASGDYKRDPDPSCEPFEVVRCETFITEATFGTPKYRWPKKGEDLGREIADWWRDAARRGVNCILFGYSLGKTQRILALLEPYAEKPVLLHSSASALTEVYRRAGRQLAPTRSLEEAVEGGSLFGPALAPGAGELILAPPSILSAPWAGKLGRYETAFASGWMQGGAGAHGRNYDRGFVISDHADWDDLNRTIRETGAQRVFVQHRDGALVRHLRAEGIDAHSADELAPDRLRRLAPRNLSLFAEQST